MKHPHPDFEPTVARVAERMARVLLPQHLQSHTDSDAIDESTAINRLWGCEATARADAEVNRKFAQED